MNIRDAIHQGRPDITSPLPYRSNSQCDFFGKGIYFSDMSSKCANYCHPSLENTEGLLLLSEVALGDCNELVNTDDSAGLLLPGKMSTKGLCLTSPDPNNSITLDGATVPLGPEVKTDREQRITHSYNEYVKYKKQPSVKLNLDGFIAP
ncbi:poly [ADP-ribose] polymerase 2-like isoform 1-T1 [Clarias gariepinus]|uniref:poly [ADP-ribose] polymerase 2-like isoform X1 n=1 Tax=Clarias gariepinus TaxID=13013 RepID=UPI00234C5E2F|nr:poly [ADP-ribose] polymerase 2-like isoform X1 [Clarias gariepinus]